VLRPGWWVLHLFTLAAGITMIFLGRWQWHVAHQHHGDIRYYAYAFQWWTFTVFAVIMWARIVLDYLRGGRSAESDVVAPTDEVVPSRDPAAVGYRAYVPPAPAGDEQDPERVRFNAYLRALSTDPEGHE